MSQLAEQEGSIPGPVLPFLLLQHDPLADMPIGIDEGTVDLGVCLMAGRKPDGFYVLDK